MADENVKSTNLFHFIFKRLLIIVLFTLIAGLVSAYISYFVIPPVYQANVNLLVNIERTKANPVLTSYIDDSLKLVSTYQDIVQSPFILKDAESNLNKQGYNVHIDEKNVSVENKTNSQVLELHVKDYSSTTASLIANAIAASVDDNIPNITGSKSEDIKIMNNAIVSPNPVSPQPLMIIGITVLIALIISIWITLFINSNSQNRKLS